MSDIQIGATAATLVLGTIYVFCFIQECKYTKQIADRFEAINKQLGYIQGKLESRG